MSVFHSHNQQSFLQKQIRKDTETQTQMLFRVRALGMLSFKEDISTKSLSAGLREPRESVKNERARGNIEHQINKGL